MKSVFKKIAQSFVCTVIAFVASVSITNCIKVYATVSNIVRYQGTYEVTGYTDRYIVVTTDDMWCTKVKYGSIRVSATDGDGTVGIYSSNSLVDVRYSGYLKSDSNGNYQGNLPSTDLNITGTVNSSYIQTSGEKYYKS